MSWKAGGKKLPPPDLSNVKVTPSNDKPASNGGSGADDALVVTRILEAVGIPCCLVGISALIFYGADRVRPVRVPQKPHLCPSLTSFRLNLTGLGNL
jgi:hypothetical protein